MWTHLPSERRRFGGARAACLASLLLAAVDGRARADGKHAPAATDAAAEPLATDPLDAYRDTFRRGVERYKAGAVGEAIQFWEPVYRELGVSKGYRMAYNLARAYEALGDSTRASERYDAFLAEFDERQRTGADVEPVVEKEAVEARARLAYLASTKGRIHVAAVDRPVSVRVDMADARLAGFVAYLAPGEHVVAFDVDTPRESRRRVTVRAGEVLELVAPPLSPVRPTAPTGRIEPASLPSPPAPSRLESSSKPRPPAATAASAPATGEPSNGAAHRPFAPVVLVAAGGAAVAAAAVTAIAYAVALNHRADYAAAASAERPQIASSYADARSFAYASLGVSLAAVAATGVLSSWYFLGGKARVAPSAAVRAGGAALGVAVRF